MKLLGEIFDYYSAYTGESILMVLFFVSLVYVALKDDSRNNRTVILYGTVALTMVIFVPVLYYGYSKYIDNETYWRVFWLLPMGIGLAYVGAKLISNHRYTGLLLALFVLFLGGKLVYTLKPDFCFATNPYHISQNTVDVANYLETLDIDNYLVAVPFEMLDDIREYDVRIRMPYGREQYIDSWGTKTGFYQLMIAENIDFVLLADKCRFNNTKYLVVNNSKQQISKPDESGFTLLKTIGGYDIYEYMGL